VLAVAASWYGLNYFQDRFYPHTAIGELNISNLTRQQANQLLSARWNKLIDQGWTFQAGAKSAIIQPTTGSADGAPPFFALDEEATINQAWENNRGNHWWQQLIKIITSWLTGHRTQGVINMNENLLRQELQNNFQTLVTSSQPAKITIQKDGSYQIKPELAGQAIDYQSGITQLGRQLLNLQQQPLTLQISDDQPLIKQSLIGDLQPVITST